jgi:hypothetical protein
VLSVWHVATLILSLGVVAGWGAEAPSGNGLAAMANGIVVGFVLSQVVLAIIPMAPQTVLPLLAPGEGLLARLASVAIALGYTLPVAAGGYAMGHFIWLLGRRAMRS